MDVTVTVKMTSQEFDLVRNAVRETINLNAEAARKNSLAKDFALARKQKEKAATYEALLAKIGR